MSRSKPAWSRRRLFGLLALAPLAGCGFHPLYGSAGVGPYNPALASIRVRRIPERVGQLLSQALDERLNPDGTVAEPRYELAVSLSVYRYDLGIQRDSSSTRGEVQLNANFVLRDLKTGKAVYNGTSRINTAFNILDDAYAATVGEQAARERGIRDLSQDIGTQLAVFLEREHGRA